MKRCIVCGSIGDDDSTVCKVCGNPFIDLGSQPDEDTDSADPMDEMEKQLKQMWSKVQAEETSGETDAPEPGEQLPSGTAGGSVSEEQLSSGLTDTSGAKEKLSPDLTVPPEAEEKTAPEPEVTVLPDPDPISMEKKESAGSTLSESQTVAEEETQRAKGPEDRVIPEMKAASASERTNSGDRNMAEQSRQEPESVNHAGNPRQPARPRRRSGPQIYGQDTMVEYHGAQGVIRRDVQGGHPSDEPRRAACENRVQAGQTRGTAPETSAQGRAVRTGTEGTDSRGRSSQGVPANGRETQTGDSGADRTRTVPSQRVSVRQRGNTQPYAQVPQEDRQQEKSTAAVRKIMEAARDAVASPLLIVVALFHTVYCAGAVAAIFMRQLDYSLFARLLNSLTLPSQLSSYVGIFQSAMAMLDNGAIAIDLVLRVPDLLFLLGIWLLCITVRTSEERMSGAGFVFVRIAVILNMIAACALLLVILVLSVTLVIASWSGAAGGRLPVAAGVLAAAVIVTMAIIMYYFCYLATISAVSRNARDGEAYGKASAYVALLHIILAFTAIVNILSGIVNLWIPVAIGGCGKFLWMLLFGVWLFSYRNTLSEYIE